MKKCPICDNNLEQNKKKVAFNYKNNTLNVMQQGLYCQLCDEMFLSPSDLKATKKEITDFKRSVDGYLQTQEIKKIRKKLKLTQKAAAEVFGGGQRAFYKYEAGEITQNKALDLLLRLFDKNKISIYDIQN